MCICRVCFSHIDLIRFISLSSLASVILITGLVTSFLTQSAVSYESRELITNDTNVKAYKTKAFGPTESIKDYDCKLKFCE